MVRIALTGTPGVGKTTLARLARERLGWRVVDAAAWAREEECIVGRDQEASSDLVDTDRLARLVPPDDGAPVLYESHWSHHLGLDAAWVVRLDPDALRGRLEERGYPPGKLRENLEVEALDLILQEALDEVPRVIQRDGTRRSPQDLLSAFVETQAAPFKSHDLEAVDWSDRLPV